MRSETLAVRLTTPPVGPPLGVLVYLSATLLPGANLALPLVFRHAGGNEKKGLQLTHPLPHQPVVI